MDAGLVVLEAGDAIELGPVVGGQRADGASERIHRPPDAQERLGHRLLGLPYPEAELQLRLRPELGGAWQVDPARGHEVAVDPPPYGRRVDVASGGAHGRLDGVPLMIMGDTLAALLRVSFEGFLAALAFVALEVLSASPAL